MEIAIETVFFPNFYVLNTEFGILRKIQPDFEL